LESRAMIVVAGWLSLVAPSAHASIDPLPPITQETLRCVWEGISEEEPRAFRLVLPRAKGQQGVVSVAVGSPGNVRAWAYSVRSAVVKDGHVAIEAADERGQRISIEGPGKAFQTCEGFIKATVKMYAADMPSVWTTTLHARDEGGFFQRINALAAGLDAIAKGETPNRQEPANPRPEADRKRIKKVGRRRI
jgi:hypothetical protein